MQESPTQTRPRAERTCSACGAVPAERGQLMCLECGARLALDYRRPSGWKLPLGIVGGVLLVAAIGLTVAISEIDDKAESEVARTPAAEPPERAAQRERAAERERGAERERAAERARAAERRRERERAASGERRPRRPPRAPAGPGGIRRWPKDTNAFTVVLASTEDPGSARRLARDVLKAGVPAGVIRSDSYSSLASGFWIVFTGVHRTRPRAERAAARLGRRYTGAFPQFVNGRG